jgi:hypothetical protein
MPVDYPSVAKVTIPSILYFASMESLGDRQSAGNWTASR